ncbi:MAG TPA: LpxD N-terminal domain-containing protein, partial [Planctomycetaceae bacterium]|nr:LpxD N-terminal domain-containing protein [Planctomycetaceae bacterium]
MGATAAELARRLGGELRGDGDLVVTNANSLQKAGPTDITFAADEKQLKRLRAGSAGIVIVPATVAAALASDATIRTLIVVADPFGAFLDVLTLFRPQRARKPVGISPQAFICETAEIGSGCNIHPGAYVGEGARIGANCELFPGAVVGDDCVL